MHTWHYLAIVAFVSLFGSSIQQSSLTFTDGYRSSCKFFLQGNFSLIISAPHGGIIAPPDVPDRTSGGCRRSTGSSSGVCTWVHNDTCSDGQKCNSTTVKDTLSDEFAENVANELRANRSLTPYVVIGKWSRKKVDFNREINEATFNHPEAILAYQSYHSNLQLAVNDSMQRFGRGLLIDIHGHGDGDYTMVGYLLTSNQLNQNDLSNPSFSSSIERLCGSGRNQCIRGPTSFGTILENCGLGIAYPSSANPKPGSIDFLSGGYITRNYLSQVSAFQTELPYYIRTGADRLTHAKNYAKAVIDYMAANGILS